MILFIVFVFLIGRLLFSPFRRRCYGSMMFGMPYHVHRPIYVKRFGRSCGGMHHFGGHRMYR